LKELTNTSLLSSALTLSEGRTIEDVGDAADYLARLTEEQREQNHWKVAIRMLNIALKEPTYLRAATMSLQTALILEGTLASARALDSH
jgi:hypothetical protein